MESDFLSDDQTREVLSDDIGFFLTILDKPRLTSTPESRKLYYERMYIPDDKLNKRLSEYIDWYEKYKENQALKKSGQDPIHVLSENAGKLMEEIAFLSFCCLKGHEGNIQSGQSEAQQLDLIITGSSPFWIGLTKLLHLTDYRKIIIEAKNTETGVDDNQMSRLCYILQNRYREQAGLGVFFSREGATGFPDDSEHNQRALHDSRATQTLFHASTGKYVVVLDHSHIIRLGEIGALPMILEALVNDVEDRLGKIIEFDKDWHEIPTLPSHLSQYLI